MALPRRVLTNSARALFIALSICLGQQATAAPPTLNPQPGVTAPGSVPELARALRYDVNLIYEYVYTNIEYSPIYGLKKGPLGTILDGRANDFDQAALMVALLPVGIHRELRLWANRAVAVTADGLARCRTRRWLRRRRCPPNGGRNSGHVECDGQRLQRAAHFC
jgi:hypothetical protein